LQTPADNPLGSLGKGFSFPLSIAYFGDEITLNNVTDEEVTFYYLSPECDTDTDPDYKYKVKFVFESESDFITLNVSDIFPTEIEIVKPPVEIEVKFDWTDDEQKQLANGEPPSELVADGKSTIEIKIRRSDICSITAKNIKVRLYSSSDNPLGLLGKEVAPQDIEFDGTELVLEDVSDE